MKYGNCKGGGPVDLEKCKFLYSRVSIYNTSIKYYSNSLRCNSCIDGTNLQGAYPRAPKDRRRMGCRVE